MADPTTQPTPVPGAPPSPGPSPTPSSPSPAAARPTPYGPAPAEEPAAELSLWTGRTNWKHFLPGMVLSALALAVLTWLLLKITVETEGGRQIRNWVLALLWVVVALAILGRMLVAIFGCKYRVTTQRLFIHKGILSQTIDQTELVRVDDVRLHKTVLDRMCGLGTVEVMTTDTSNPNVRLVGIAAPEWVGEQIRANMKNMRKRAVFVENV